MGLIYLENVPNCGRDSRIFVHFFFIHSHDASQLRRGFQVYQQYAPLGTPSTNSPSDVTHIEEHMRALANEYQGLDGEPDAESNPVIRPGKPTDHIPGPY